jgi:hypothetical protein
MDNNVKPWDILNPNIPRSSEDVQNNRISICESCERFFKPTRQCKECGCFMDIKTKLEQASCPLEKW